MNGHTKASTKAMITIEPNESGGFNVYAGFNGEGTPSPQMRKAGDLALLGMLAIAKELEEAKQTTKTTIH